MGWTTHQYSAKEIIEKYQIHITNNQKNVDDLKQIIETPYIKEKHIDSFLNKHLGFCNDAINVLEDAVKRIEFDAVDESICLRLETLFANCYNEQRELEDTYNRVGYQQSEEFYRYKIVLAELSDECNCMGYCDETVKFVRAMISSKTNTNYFMGDAKNIQIQQGCEKSLQRQNASDKHNDFFIEDTLIEKEKTSINDIIRGKIFEAIIGMILITVAWGINNLMKMDMISSLSFGIRIAMLFLMIACGIGAIVNGLAVLFDLINIVRLMQKGKFVEFVSKRVILGTILSVFRDETDIYGERCVGKTYKNIGGDIYKIKYKICPFCQTEPIGKMYLVKQINNPQYMWICSEQSSHIMEFDYKKEF